MPSTVVEGEGKELDRVRELVYRHVAGLTAALKQAGRGSLTVAFSWTFEDGTVTDLTVESKRDID